MEKTTPVSNHVASAFFIAGTLGFLTAIALRVLPTQPLADLLKVGSRTTLANYTAIASASLIGAGVVTALVVKVSMRIWGIKNPDGLRQFEEKRERHDPSLPVELPFSDTPILPETESGISPQSSLWNLMSPMQEAVKAFEPTDAERRIPHHSDLLAVKSHIVQLGELKKGLAALNSSGKEVFIRDSSDIHNHDLQSLANGLTDWLASLENYPELSADRQAQVANLREALAAANEYLQTHIE